MWQWVMRIVRAYEANLSILTEIDADDIGGRGCIIIFWLRCSSVTEYYIFNYRIFHASSVSTVPITRILYSSLVKWINHITFRKQPQLKWLFFRHKRRAHVARDWHFSVYSSSLNLLEVYRHAKEAIVREHVQRGRPNKKNDASSDGVVFFFCEEIDLASWKEGYIIGYVQRATQEGNWFPEYSVCACDSQSAQ